MFLSVSMRVSLLCCSVFWCIPITAEEPQDTQSNNSINLLFYLHEKNQVSERNRFLPFYSYERNSEQKYEDFFFWPLLTGYEINKNLLPEEHPFATSFKWYSFPFLTMGGNYVSILESAQTNTLVSFAFLTFFQDRIIPEKYNAKTWYSLPVLSFYNRETLFEDIAEIDHVAFGNPVFTFQDTYIAYDKKRFPIYQWAIDPTFVALGEDSFTIASQERWGSDFRFSFLSLNSFAVFRVSTTFDHYPGAQYRQFKLFESDLESGLKKLFSSPKDLPTTRWGIISPIIMMETNPSGKFFWQILPLMEYMSTPDSFEVTLLPLAISFGSEGIKFTPKAKFFPLIYHDAAYGSWDFLWPVFRYVSDPTIPHENFTIRFLLDYQRNLDVEGDSYMDIILVERLLMSYSQTPKSKELDVLPFGILFSYTNSESKFEWRFLGFGYEKTLYSSNLQMLFFKIPLQ